MEIWHKIKDLIEIAHEGEYWDYKERHHDNPADFVHDVICLANNRANIDAYIIMGIYDGERLGEVCGVEDDTNRRNQQQIVTLLRAPKWAFNTYPQIELKTLKFGQHEVDVLTIKSTYDVPYYLTEDYSRGSGIGDKKRTVHANYIYTRVCDSNTPIDQNAAPNQIEHLWKLRFGILLQPIEQMKRKLSTKTDWKSYEDEENGDIIYYNKFSPEYTLRVKSDEDGLTPEFYSYNQYNEATSYKMLYLMYHATVLEKVQIVYLDSGRYATPCPVWGYIHDSGHSTQLNYSYKYILEDSLEYIIQLFLFDQEDGEECFAKGRFDEVVLYFRNSCEQATFHKQLESNPNLLLPILDMQKMNVPVVQTGTDRLDKIHTERIMIAKAVKQLQKERQKI